jgi:hypothetical protein
VEPVRIAIVKQCHNSRVRTMSDWNGAASSSALLPLESSDCRGGPSGLP